ncbi:MAG: DoxX family protein [Chitinophagaceae bacterium]|nr:DoxX family protein [Chitinophagaceae bacterium]
MKRFFSTRYSETWFSLGLFILRAFGGGLLLPHGLDKMNKFGEMAPTFMDPFGIGPSVSLALLIFAEFFCSIFLILGLFTRLACIPLIIAMVVALFIAHKGHIFTDGEHAALYLGIYVTLLFTGPGKFSIDKVIGK